MSETTGFPLLEASFRPRTTIRSVVGGSPWRAPVLLAVAGVMYVLSAPTPLGADAAGGVARLVLAALVVAAITVPLVWAMAAVAALLGRRLGGAANTRDIVDAVAWGSAPLVLCLPVVGILFAIAAQTGATATAVAGLAAGLAGCWATVTTTAMLAEVQRFSWPRAWLNLLIAGLVILLPLLALRAWVIQPFSMSSASMSPMLAPGNIVYAWKLDQASGRGLKRGDVVAYRYPRNQTIVFLGRIIAVSGDTVQMKDGVVHLNGQAVPKVRMADQTVDVDGERKAVPTFKETLPGGPEHLVLDLETRGMLDNTPTIKVPEGRVFVMGDNRDNVTDSRLPFHGPVPVADVIGRVVLVF